MVLARAGTRRSCLSPPTITTTRLPSRARASSLCEAYLTNLSWFFRPIDRSQLVEELMPMIYNYRGRDGRKASGGDPTLEGPVELDPDIDMHDLALLLASFACGAAGDLTLPPYNDEAELYRTLALSCMPCKPILESDDGASLSSVQAAVMLGAYHLFSGRKNSLEHTWKIQGVACMLAASVS